MKVLKELKYSKDHEWVRLDGNRAYVGITDYAQNSLGDIVFVELPEIDSQINSGDTMGVVESIKAASDIYSPVSGRVVEINEALSDAPESINQDPYENWIAVFELDDESELDELMDADAYEKLCAEEEG